MMKRAVRVGGWIALLGSLLISPAVFAQDNPWQEINTPDLNSVYDTIEPLTAIAPDGKLYFVWVNGFDDVYVKRFDGTTWEEIGHTQGAVSGNHTVMAVASDGTIYVAWITIIDGSGIEYIYIRRLNGMVWEEVGAGSASGTGIARAAKVAMAIAPDGTVYLVWPGAYGEFGPYVKRFNGTVWEEVGTGSASCCDGISYGETRGIDPSIDIDSNNVPYVAWICQYAGPSIIICMRRFNGTSWEEVGENSATYPGAISDIYDQAAHPSLVIGPGDIPYIAWQKWGRTIIDGRGNANWEIFIRRFNGTEWEEVGEGSATNGGVSYTYCSHSLLPSLIFTGDGVPYISWTEATASCTGPENLPAIFVRRFNGTEWEETHPGSATVEGIDSDSSVDPDNGAELIAESNAAYMTWVEDEEEATGAQLAANGSQFRIQSLQYSAPNATPSLNFHTISTPTLTWNRTSWATAYEIQIDKSRTFTTPEIPPTELSLDTLSFQTPALDSATYYWRVRARKADNSWGAWSKPESFVILLPW